MRKDPTEFRKRFQSWKLGIPAYKGGKPIDYTKAAQESRDREYNTAMSYFKSTPNVLNIAKGVYHFAKSTPLFGDTPASVNPNMIYGDAPAVGYRNATNLVETTRRIKAAVKPFVNGVSNTKLSTQALQQEIRYGDTYYPEQLTIAERNAMAKLRQSKLAKEKGKYVMVDNAPKVGLKNYVLMENGKPQAEMIASMEEGSIIPEMVYKTNKSAHHTTTDLYSGILKYLKQAGNTGGIISGESYKSAPATLKQIKKFKKEKVSDNGTWDNEGLVGYDQEPTVVKTMEEADKLNKKSKAFILYNQPIYRLLQPVKDIPIKDRYMFDPRRIGPNGEYNIDMSNPSRFAQNQDDSNLRHYFRGGKNLNMGPRRDLSISEVREIAGKSRREQPLDGADPLLKWLIPQRAVGKAISIGREIFNNHLRREALREYREAREAGHDKDISRFIATPNNPALDILNWESRIIDWGFKNGKDLPRFADGDDVTAPNGYVRANGNPIAFDEEGNLTDQITGEKGSMRIGPNDVIVTGRDTSSYRSSFDPNAANEFTGMIPIVGDVQQGVQAVDAAKQGDYTQAALLGAGMLLPNAMEKAAKPLVPLFKKTPTTWVGKFWDFIKKPFQWFGNLFKKKSISPPKHLLLPGENSITHEMLDDDFRNEINKYYSAKLASETTDPNYLRSFRDVNNFLMGPMYKQRVASEAGYNTWLNVANRLLDNLKTTKVVLNPRYILYEDPGSPTGWGAYGADYAGIHSGGRVSVFSDSADDIYDHEFLHAANRPSDTNPYHVVNQHNLKYKMKPLKPGGGFDIEEETQRVRAGMMDMLKRGYDYNSYDDIDRYLSLPIKELPENVQQLIGVYGRKQTREALRRFWGVTGVATAGAATAASANDKPSYKRGKDIKLLPRFEEGKTPLGVVDKAKASASDKVMQFAQSSKGDVDDPTGNSTGDNNAAQSTYLLDRDTLKKVFLDKGYMEGQPGDYGLVKRAVGNRNIPVYQTALDAIDRKDLTPIGNLYSGVWFASPEAELEHAGTYPSAIYRGNDGKFYLKAWDLNDYGNTTGRSGQDYTGYRLYLANLLDFFGSPTVVTTGYQPIDEELNYTDSIKDFMSLKGLYPIGDGQYGLPELVIVKNKRTGQQSIVLKKHLNDLMQEEPDWQLLKDVEDAKRLLGFKNGKDIYIKPSHRGRLTALKKRTGKSEAELYKTGGPAVRKMITFARNARKWKH